MNRHPASICNSVQREPDREPVDCARKWKVRLQAKRKPGPKASGRTGSLTGGAAAWPFCRA
jgi:hypothetical protein